MDNTKKMRKGQICQGEQAGFDNMEDNIVLSKNNFSEVTGYWIFK